MPITSVTKLSNLVWGFLRIHTPAFKSGVETLYDKVNEVVTESNTQETDITTIQGDVLAAEGDITTLQGDVLAAEGDITTLQGDVLAAEGDIITAQNDIVDLRLDVDRIVHPEMYSISSDQVALATTHECIATDADTILQIYGNMLDGGGVRDFKDDVTTNATLYAIQPSIEEITIELVEPAGAAALALAYDNITNTITVTLAHDGAAVTTVWSDLRAAFNNPANPLYIQDVDELVLIVVNADNLVTEQQIVLQGTGDYYRICRINGLGYRELGSTYAALIAVPEDNFMAIGVPTADGAAIVGRTATVGTLYGPKDSFPLTMMVNSTI